MVAKSRGAGAGRGVFAFNSFAPIRGHFSWGGLPDGTARRIGEKSRRSATHSVAALRYVGLVAACRAIWIFRPDGLEFGIGCEKPATRCISIFIFFYAITRSDMLNGWRYVAVARSHAIARLAFLVSCSPQ